VLRVTVELWPAGDDRRAVVLHRLDIWNESESLPDVSDYGYATGRGSEARHGRVLGHRRSAGAWKLIARIVREARL
jgi:hypothetical protein